MIAGASGARALVLGGGGQDRFRYHSFGAIESHRLGAAGWVATDRAFAGSTITAPSWDVWRITYAGVDGNGIVIPASVHGDGGASIDLAAGMRDAAGNTLDTRSSSCRIDAAAAAAAASILPPGVEEAGTAGATPPPAEPDVPQPAPGAAEPVAAPEPPVEPAAEPVTEPTEPVIEPPADPVITPPAP